MCARVACHTRVFNPRLVFCIISRHCRFAAAQDLGNGAYYLAKKALPPAVLARLEEQLKEDIDKPRNYAYHAPFLIRALKCELYAPGPNGEVALYR